MKRYNNPENLSPSDILFKLAYSFSYRGDGRMARKRVLESYSTELITEDEWIKRWCK